MFKKDVIASKVGTIIFIVIVIFILSQLYGVYKTYYYNGFTKAEYIKGVTKFRRDKNVKYSDDNSYKLESSDFNDAVFYKEIKVKPNTPYRISCMVKTEDIVNEEEKTNSGAQICIIGSIECSESVVGTSDWTEIEFMFNSKNRDTIQIGFRIGGNKGHSKGTAWFSDFVLEEGYREEDSTWNMGLFIFRNVEVEIDTDNGNENLKISMTENDIYTLRDNMERFKKSCSELSGNQMNVEYDIYEITDPITSISYSEEFGYYVDPIDVKEQLEEYLSQEEYDHILVAVRLGNYDEDIEIPVYDWIGLGGMDLNDVGFSNIRLPNDKNNYIYTYNVNINQFPEEVMLHEFLHSLERIMIEYEYDIPELHDNLEYGYEEEKVIGLKKWYADYMSKKILDTSKNEYIGLEPIVYLLKPVHKSDFDFPIVLEFNKEPKNIMEEVSAIFKVVTRVVTRQEV